MRYFLNSRLYKIIRSECLKSSTVLYEEFKLASRSEVSSCSLFTIYNLIKYCQVSEEDLNKYAIAIDGDGNMMEKFGPYLFSEKTINKYALFLPVLSIFYHHSYDIEFVMYLIKPYNFIPFKLLNKYNFPPDFTIRFNNFATLPPEIEQNLIQLLSE